MKVFVVLLALVAATTYAKEIGVRNFEGYQVLSVAAETKEQHEFLKKLIVDSIDYDFWSSPKMNGFTDIMVHTSQMKEFNKLLEPLGMKYIVKIQSVSKLVAEEKAANDAELQKAEGRMVWTAYNSWAVIEPWIQGLAEYDIASVVTIGRTFEGRNIYAVKVSTGGPPKKSIFIDGNIHAREWIAGATVSWILNELVTNSDRYMEFLREVDFYIVPYINVDGYEFSRNTDRMWRKTRSTSPGSICLGCDPNRNWSKEFGGESTSPNPCSDIYKGPHAFSESETLAIKDYIESLENAGVRFWAFLTIHSYAQMWLLSWGYRAGVYPPDYPELLALGRESIAALNAVHGTRYTTGQGADMLYGVGGASDDWAKDHGIKYAVTAELRDTGSYGFLLPANQIIPTSQETWEAFKVYIRKVMTH